jgi:hypothetical protein
MKRQVGLWIDHAKAVIFSLADEGAEIKRIVSKLGNDARISGGIQKESITGHLNNHYDEVLSYIRDAEAILIFGPGEAKLKLKRKLENLEIQARIVGFETVEKMTDSQIVAKVRKHFLK